MIVKAGQRRLLEWIFQGKLIIETPTFYVGLCDYTPTLDDTLLEVQNEPVASGDYARIALALNDTDWPDLNLVNNSWAIVSKTITFTGPSGAYPNSITRSFLTDAASGTSGTLIAVSSALPQPILIDPSTSFPMTWLEGLR